MNEDKFQETVLSGVDTLTKEQTRIKTDVEKALADVGQLSKSTQADIAAIKTSCNDFATSLAAIQKAQRSVAMEARNVYGDPAKRFASNPDNANWLAGIARRAYGVQPWAEEQLILKASPITGVDSGIGAGVTPQETAAAIYDTLLQYGQWSTLGVMPIGSRTQLIPIVTARPTAYWTAQGVAIDTEGTITGTTVTLTIKEAAAYIGVARPVIEDSAVDLAAYVMRELAQAVAYRLDWACFAADSTDDVTDGNYEGIAYAGTAASATAGNTTVGELELDDFVRCLTTVDAGVLSRPAKWWIHPQVLAKICLIRDSNGRPIFQNGMDAPSPGAIGSILGYPVIVTAAMPSSDSAGKVVAVFGDPQGMAVGIRKDFEWARSDEFRFTSNQSVFRVVVRAGCVVKIATAFGMLTTAAA